MSTRSEKRTLQKAATASLSQALYFSLWFLLILGQSEVCPLSGTAVLRFHRRRVSLQDCQLVVRCQEEFRQHRRWPARKTLVLNKVSEAFSFSQQSRCSDHSLFVPPCTTKLLLHTEPQKYACLNIDTKALTCIDHQTYENTMAG